MRTSSWPFPLILAGVCVMGCGSSDTASTSTPARATPSTSPASAVSTRPALTTTSVVASSIAVVPTSEASAGPVSTAPATTPTTAAAVPDGVVIPYEVGVLEVTDGGVWVFPHLEPVAVRIDPSTMTVVDEVALTSYATESVYRDGALWIRTELDESSYSQLDPTTGEVLARVPNVAGDRPMIAFGRIWTVGVDGSLVTIDLETNTVESIPIQTPDPWVATTTSDMVWTLGTNGLIGVDPNTGETTPPWRPLELLGERPTYMDSTDRDTLLFATPGRLSEIDPIAHTLIGSVDAPEGMSPLYSVNYGNGGGQPPTWIFHADGQPMPDQGQPLPDVVVASVDLDRMALAESATVPFPESHVRDGSTLWSTPVFSQIVSRTTMG